MQTFSLCYGGDCVIRERERERGDTGDRSNLTLLGVVLVI